MRLLEIEISVRGDLPFLERLKLNKNIANMNKYLIYPLDEDFPPELMQVGRFPQFTPKCAEWSSDRVCDNLDGHEGKNLNGSDATGKVVVKHEHWWCNYALCSKCFLNGWVPRTSRSMEARLNEGVKRGLGKVEHGEVSVKPEVARALPFSVLKEKTRAALAAVGIFDVELVFHGARLDRKRHVLVHSPHFHWVGFVRGGVDICRNCVHVREDCYDCPCFKGRGIREFRESGYLVKVFEERRTVFGTLKYILSHATIRRVRMHTRFGVQRFSPITYLGALAPRRMKIGRVKAVVGCPLCSKEMTRKVYVGEDRSANHVVKDINSPDYVPVFLDVAYCADGSDAYVDVPSHVEFGGGGSEG